MSIFKLENLTESSIYITPNFPTLRTKRYKFRFLAVLGFISIYTAAAIFLFSLLVAFTPARKVLLFFENRNIIEQAEKIEKLEKQLILLNSELESISSTNQRLKYALILAGTDSLDSTAAVYDSLRKFSREKNKIDGNILAAFRLFIEMFYQNDNQQNQVFISPSGGSLINRFDEEKGHIGIDFGVKENTPVYAAASGFIVFSEYTVKDGYVIIIQHQNNYKTFYKHCAQLLIKEREYVQIGEMIALSGNTGYNTTGPHLHFEIWKNEKPLNPVKIITNLMERENGK